MKIQLDHVQRSDNCCWQVSMDKHWVGFRSETEARQFIVTLQRRLSAPHVLPRQARSAHQAG